MLVGGSTGPKLFAPAGLRHLPSFRELVPILVVKSVLVSGCNILGGRGTLPPTYRVALGYFTFSRQLHRIGAGHSVNHSFKRVVSMSVKNIRS